MKGLPVRRQPLFPSRRDRTPEPPGRAVPLRGTGEGGSASGAAPLLPAPFYPSCLPLMDSQLRELPAHTGLQSGVPDVIYSGRHIRRPAG